MTRFTLRVLGGALISRVVCMAVVVCMTVDPWHPYHASNDTSMVPWKFPLEEGLRPLDRYSVVPHFALHGFLLPRLKLVRIFGNRGGPALGGTEEYVGFSPTRQAFACTARKAP